MKGIDVLKQYLGKNERDNEQELKDFFKRNSVHNDITINPNGSEKDGLPWCSASVNASERQAYGITAGTGSLMARSFLRYGTIIYDKQKAIGAPVAAQYGDIAIWARGAPPSGHVNYIEQVFSDHFICIGGNQGDAVTREKYSFDNLLGVRRSNF